MKSSLKKLIGIFPLFFLYACTVGPKYAPPSQELPDEWKNDKNEASLEADEALDLCNFWELFQDETLNALEEKALKASPTLQIALAKIEESWSIAGISRAALFPQITVNPQYQNTGELFKLYLPSSVTSSPALQGLPGDFRIHAFNYVLPFNMNYEVDLFGKNRSLYSRAQEIARASVDNYTVAMLRITTDVASSYFYIRTLESQINALETMLKVKQLDLDLAIDRYDKGLTNQLNLLQMKETVHETEIDLLDAKQKKENFINTIAFLIGEPASNFDLEKTDQKLINPPNVPSGIPSTLLGRRPDIRAKEHEMRASHYLINVAYADLLPSFSLTGTLGFSSPEYKQFLGWMSRLWSYGGGINQALFDGGARFSNIDASYANFAESSWSYQETVLRALQEVETALSDLELITSKIKSQDEILKERKTAFELANERLREGLSNQTEENQYHTSLLNGELQNAALLGAKYQATLELIKALGGSW